MTATIFITKDGDHMQMVVNGMRPDDLDVVASFLLEVADGLRVAGPRADDDQMREQIAKIGGVDAANVIVRSL